MPIKSVKSKILKNKMRLFLMSPKKIGSYVNKTHRQTKWLQSTPFQGFGNLSFDNIESCYIATKQNNSLGWDGRYRNGRTVIKKMARKRGTRK